MTKCSAHIFCVPKQRLEPLFGLTVYRLTRFGNDGSARGAKTHGMLIVLLTLALSAGSAGRPETPDTTAAAPLGVGELGLRAAPRKPAPQVKALEEMAAPRGADGSSWVALGLAFVQASDHHLLDAALAEATRLRTAPAPPTGASVRFDVGAAPRSDGAHGLELETSALRAPLGEGALRGYGPTRSLVAPGLP
ncbi:MAG: hypothetical protein JNK82_33870 [Myxococcaceae bacterium]|nr:hypothetical protein [Myxococcaceae bacterium]